MPLTLPSLSDTHRGTDSAYRHPDSVHSLYFTIPGKAVGNGSYIFIFSLFFLSFLLFIYICRKLSQVKIVIYIKKSIYNKDKKNLRQAATGQEKCVELGKDADFHKFCPATYCDNNSAPYKMSKDDRAEVSLRERCIGCISGISRKCNIILRCSVI